MDGSGAAGLWFLGRRLPPSFRMRAVVIAAGGARRFDEAEWRDALVVVERGQAELECADGDRRRFARGDVLWLSGLSLRAIRNPGREPAVLVAVSRRAGGDGFSAGAPSHGESTPTT